MNLLLKFLTAVTDAATDPEGIAWHPEEALGMLKHMGIGMLVIFVIIGVIILATLLVNKIFSAKK